MNITLNPYRCGLILGVMGTVGVLSVFDGILTLILGRPDFMWSSDIGIVAIILGIVNLAITYALYRWFNSIFQVMKAQQEVESEQDTEENQNLF